MTHSVPIGALHVFLYLLLAAIIIKSYVISNAWLLDLNLLSLLPD